MRLVIILCMMACYSMAADTNKVDKAEKDVKVEKEKKTDHEENKIVVKSRDKGSKKESDWQTDKEFVLMFKNNRKARKPKDK